MTHTEVHIPHPVFEGDTIYSQSKVLPAKERWIYIGAGACASHAKRVQ